MGIFQKTKFYPVLHEGVDFFADRIVGGIDKGTRAKKYVTVYQNTKKTRKAYFKYDNGKKFRQGEDCSEKIASEIAKILGYKTAEIDLAEGASGERGLISYLFVDPSKNESHIDMEDFLSEINRENESKEYTIKRIENRLHEKFPDTIFEDLIKIIFFDALVGERDRHIGNWGITTKNGMQSISPLYDTASCLLRDFQNPKTLEKYTKDDEKFKQYINNNQLAFYKEDGEQNYSPTDSVVDFLLVNYPKITLKEIHNLFKLNNDIIESIVNKIPKNRMSDEHKFYIIKYLKLQRDKIIHKGQEYEKK